ncbi:homeobox protein cut-like [Eurosta solidaginis]|uniref:homeobox protein cut-like n=1 Tax=Eurosta solidaginis TaxID=178769 RepID=UPI0035311DF8
MVNDKWFHILYRSIRCSCNSRRNQRNSRSSTNNKNDDDADEQGNVDVADSEVAANADDVTAAKIDLTKTIATECIEDDKAEIIADAELEADRECGQLTKVAETSASAAIIVINSRSNSTTALAATNEATTIIVDENKIKTETNSPLDLDVISQQSAMAAAAVCANDPNKFQEFLLEGHKGLAVAEALKNASAKGTTVAASQQQESDDNIDDDDAAVSNSKEHEKTKVDDTGKTSDATTIVTNEQIFPKILKIEILHGEENNADEQQRNKLESAMNCKKTRNQ